MKKIFLTLAMCICMIFTSIMPINAQEINVNQSQNERAVWTEKRGISGRGGIVVIAELLLNDVDGVTRIKGTKIVKATPDLGITNLSASGKIYDNGLYAVITITYNDWGVPASERHIVYPE